MIPKGLLDELKRWIREGLYGHLQINFSGGKIMSINRVQTVKVDMLVITTEPTFTSQIDRDVTVKLTGTGNLENP